MRNFITVLILSIVSNYITGCQTNQFTVYYVPLDVQTYTPLSREDIMKNGIRFEIDTQLLTKVFKEIYSKDPLKPAEEDLASLRIIIINKENNEEIFITSDKVVLSISKIEKYIVDKNLVNDILSELTDFIDKNNLKESSFKSGDN